jgi:drug/metabolite transporter (DMT)-like permease
VTAASILSGGALFGLLGVVCFSGTPVATRAAAPAVGAVTLTCARIVVAAALGGLLLWWRRPIVWPGRALVPRLLALGIGVAVLYPLCLALAVERVPASHAAVVLALVPVATAVAATVRSGERPQPLFWAASATGVAAVAAFALTQAGGAIRLADVLLVVSVIGGAVGYAEGADAARAIGATAALCWGLILMAPGAAVGLACGLVADPPGDLSAGAWAGLAYACVVAMFLGSVLWYAGLARGGTARVGQINLAQPLLAIVWAALLLDEQIGRAVPLTAVAVVASMAVCLRTGPGSAREPELRPARLAPRRP